MNKLILFNTPVSDALVILNAIISLVIVIRLLSFKREGSRHRKWGGWVAYIMIVIYAYFPIKLAFGQLVIIDWPSIVVNAIFMCALLRLKGNVVQLFKTASGQQ